MKTPVFLSEAGRALQRWLMEHAGLRIERARPRTKRPEEGHRYTYQQRHVDFDIPPGARVLDIGSGGDPSPHATVLVDRYPGRTHHRAAALVRDDRQFVEADVANLPFPDKSFDFVYCSHVLEHVPDPLAACREIMRVGHRGYIETPTRAKDILFAWQVPDMHKWHVVAIANHLCFFELSPRESAGVRSKVWQKAIFGRWQHPLQDLFFDNQDLFNVMFPWRERFQTHLFLLDGTQRSLGTTPVKCAPLPCTQGA